MKYPHAKLSLLTVLLCTTGLAFSGSDGWYHWRGSEQQGVSHEKNLPDKWSADGENLLWKAPYGTRATPLVMNNRVYLINRAGEGETVQERVMALDFNTGKMVWEHRFNVFLTDVVEHRLGWAQLAGDPETGYIYAHGVQGLFYCFDKDGKILWSRSLTEEFGRVSGYGGRTNSPIIDGDLVILNSMTSSWGPHGPGSHRFWAMNKFTGEIVWWSSPSDRPLDTTYSVPVVAEVNGERLLIAGLADGWVRALQVSTGKLVWSYLLSKRGLNTSVVYNDGLVYASHSEENIDTNVMGAVVCIDAAGQGDVTKTHEKWRIDGLVAGYSSGLLVDGMLMIPDNSANLFAIDAKSGEKLWSFNYGTAAKGSPLYADGKVYVGAVGGSLNILKVSREGAERLDEDVFTLPDGAPDEIYSSPAVYQGRVLLTTKNQIFCITKDAKRKPPKIAKAKAAKKVEPGPPAQLQIVPAETVIASGGSQKYTARTFDAKGNFIGEVKAEWSAVGVAGAFSDSTFNAADKKDNTQGGVITAKVGDLQAKSLLRIMPPLPYSEDFEDLPLESTPGGWLTSKVKGHVVEMDGNKVFRKLAGRSHPAFARMRCYVMPPLDQGYTIQADMNGQSKKRRFVPDMGLINSRYTLIIMGTVRERALRLVTWDPMPRLQKDVPFAWEADKWYTAKLAYSIRDGKGWVRAKVWPRDEAEPADWMIELEDPLPNPGGSPALYGYSVAISDNAPGTEVFYDNVRVYQNE